MIFKKRKPNGYNLNYIYTDDYEKKRIAKEKLLNTAISSWSGFVYQGKVAIYHVLKEINNPNFTLQLDSLDDFAILDANGNIISMHQVKAKKSHYFSTYNEAFSQLQDGGLIAGCNSLHFHLAQIITDKTVPDIEIDYSPVKVYKYGISPFCSVDNIDAEIETLIIELMRTKFFPTNPSKATNEYAEKVRNNLDNILVKKLFKIHQIIHDGILPETRAAYDKRIEFLEFENILSQDLNEQGLGEDYYLYQLKSDVCKYYQEYCLEYEDELEDENLQKLNKFIIQFERLNRDDLIKFIRNIIPHREFIFDSLSDYKDKSFTAEEIKDVLLYTLHQIDKEPDYISKSLMKWTILPKTYSPTCIISAQRHQEKVCQRIIKNALTTDLDILFENQKLITSNIDIPSIASNHIVRNTEDERHIMNWKKVSLISIENAKREIDG